MNISTKDLSDVLDEAESFTIAHCADIIAAAERVRALGPLQPEPPLPDHVNANPFTYVYIFDARSEKRRAAEDAHGEAQEAALGNVELPLNWYLNTFSDGSVTIHHGWIRRDCPINPDATPAALLAFLRAGTTAALAEAAADWRTQAADLLARAALAERLATAMFPTPEPTP